VLRLASVLRVIRPMQRHGDCLNCHGRGPVPLVHDSKVTLVGLRAMRGLLALTSKRYRYNQDLYNTQLAQRSVLCRLQVHAEAARGASCFRQRKCGVAPPRVSEMPNLADL
jgi:hypothetical protein